MPEGDVSLQTDKLTTNYRGRRNTNRQRKMGYKNTTGFHRGHKFVDLGFLSGLKWATCNVGAKEAEQTGLYFAFGETTGVKIGQEMNLPPMFFTENSYNTGNISSPYGILSPSCDAARVCMGGEWRMPTEAEVRELLLNTTKKWIRGSKNKINGMLFTSKFNGESVFFPEAGYVESGTLVDFSRKGYIWTSSDKKGNAGVLMVVPENSSFGNLPYYVGLPVRGVLDF